MDNVDNQIAKNVRLLYDISEEEWNQLDDEGKNCFIVPYKMHVMLKEISRESRFL